MGEHEPGESAPGRPRPTEPPDAALAASIAGGAPAGGAPGPLADRASAADLRRRLGSWYRARRRDLPWRRTRDPYAVWISEAMLQQTRVETVLDYYSRFLARFPDVASLAAAPEAEVLALWSGLGYYRRARDLWRAAQAIVERHGGRFPRDPDAARALPGVGPYTAGAVLSIAFDLPEAAVDGNVERVLSRLLALADDPSSGAGRRRLLAAAARLVPARGAGAWNQALMELGATVCAPRRPRCPACPVERRCRARALGLEEELPRRRPRPAAMPVLALVLLVRRGERWLLERRGAGEGRMAGLLQFPTIELPGPGGVASGLFPPAFPRGAGGRALLEPEGGLDLAELRHSITRHRIRARVARGRARPGGDRSPASWLWAARAELEGRGLALTGMARKVAGAGLLERARAADEPGG